ncbi:MAG: hypothetical protein ACRDFW_09530 [bacterium]
MIKPQHLKPGDAVAVVSPSWGGPGAIPRRYAMGKRELEGRFGKLEGHLLGGCLDTLEMAKGTRWWPSLDEWRGAIFFWETSEEAPKPHLVTRWLLNYAAQGILDVIGAMLVGRPRGYSREDREELHRRLKDLIGRELGRPHMPVVAEMDRQEVVLPDQAVV